MQAKLIRRRFDFHVSRTSTLLEQGSGETENEKGGNKSERSGGN